MFDQETHQVTELCNSKSFEMSQPNNNFNIIQNIEIHLPPNSRTNTKTDYPTTTDHHQSFEQIFVATSRNEPELQVTVNVCKFRDWNPPLVQNQEIIHYNDPRNLNPTLISTSELQSNISRSTIYLPNPSSECDCDMCRTATVNCQDVCNNYLYPHINDNRTKFPSTSSSPGNADHQSSERILFVTNSSKELETQESYKIVRNQDNFHYNETPKTINPLAITSSVNQDYSNTYGSPYAPTTPEYSCNICRLIFGCKNAHDSHQRSSHKNHEPNKPNPHKCAYCEKSFYSKQDADYHTRIHTGGRPYRCAYCDKSFSQLSSRTIHTRVHTDERPYRCNYCPKSFHSKQAVDYHVRTHTGERPYKCAYCEKAFIQSSSLTVHTRRHTGERPYKCDYCDKSFYVKQAVDCHMRVHRAQGNNGLAQNYYTK